MRRRDRQRRWRDSAAFEIRSGIGFAQGPQPQRGRWRACREGASALVMPYNAGMAALGAEVAEGSSQSERARDLYWTDFYSWTQNQVAALRDRDLGGVDWDNVIEEIETLGRSERRAWTNTAARAIEHLLKIQHWEFASASDLRHWMGEIRTWRRQMADTIQDNPGLQGQYSELLLLAWQRGRAGAIDALVDAAVEREGASRGKLIELEWKGRLPRQCPWPIEEIVAYDTRPRYRQGRARGPRPERDVWPPAVARRLNEELGECFPQRLIGD